jgi:UDP-N-acetylmuramyl tripeptide synthase
LAARKRSGSGGAPRAGLRDYGALFLGKMLIVGTRLLKHGGTTLPGRVALKVSPQLLSFMAGQLPMGTIAVTGTNGKTTTASLLAAIFRQGGLRCVHNKAGSNLAWGVATTLIETGAWKEGLPGDIAVMEMDEGAFPAISKDMQPRGAVVTNIFRDQLDRFGGVQQVQDAISRGVQAMSPGAAVFLNADDPLLAGIDSGGRKTIYYGFDLPRGSITRVFPERGFPCPRCHRDLIYTDLYYAHLGRYRCANCGFMRPEPEFKLRRFETAPEGGALATLSLRGKLLQAALPLPGIYNLYNALAAAAAATALDMPEAAIRDAFAAAAPPSGRMERRRLGNKDLLIALIKNPAGAGEVFRTLLQGRGDSRIHFLIAINDRPADGRDISWLWETDFEQLAGLRFRTGSMVLSGTRAVDVARRLKKAGFDGAKMIVEPVLRRALQKALAATAPGEKLIILPNYTAMMQLRRLLK